MAKRFLFLVLAGLVAFEVFARTEAVTAQAPTVTPTPTPTPKPEKPPTVDEVRVLRITNAILRANVEQARHEKALKDLGDVIAAEIAAIEKEHPGWMFDARTLTLVKRPPPKTN